MVLETDTSNADEGFLKSEAYYIWMNISVISLSLPVIILCVITMCVIQKCITIPFQIRYISTSFLLSEGIAHFILITHQLVLTPGVDVRSHWGLISRGFTFALMETISLVSVTLLAVERVLTIAMPLRFVAWVTKKRAVICITAIVSSDVIICTCALIYGILETCVYGISCTVAEATGVCRFAVVTLSVLYETTIFVSYLIILRIMRRHQRQISDTRPGPARNYDRPTPEVFSSQYRSSRAIFFIVLVNFILNIPFAVNVAAYQIHWDTKWGGLLELFSFICKLANSIISGVLYVWSFKECRLKFLTMFLSWAPRYRARAEEMRLDVYSIVTRPARYKRSDGTDHPAKPAD